MNNVQHFAFCVLVYEHERGYEDELQVNPVSLDGGEDVTFIKVCPKCNDEDYLIDPWEDDSEG